MNFSLTFTEETYKNLAKLAGLVESVHAGQEIALDIISESIQKEIPNQMAWKNPRPVLADSFGRKKRDGYREVGSPEPHARRREFGFSGRTDSLGRTYSNDPGAFYMQRAIKQVAPQATAGFSAAMAKALKP